jgi:hypothetical protein
MKIKRRDLPAVPHWLVAALLGRASDGRAAKHWPRTSGSPAPAAGRVRHRAHCCGDDGESSLTTSSLAAERGRNADRSLYLIPAGVAHATHALAPDFQGCDHLTRTTL